MTEIELHPLCTLFPRMAGAEFDALCSDIKANGLRSPIVLHEGMILDGGNRYRACLEAGAAPQFSEFSGGSLVGFVLSANLHRRHMSAGQQAAIVASAQDWAQAQVQGANRHTMKTGNVAGLATVEDRAAQSGASERTQRMADKVARADPALAVQVGHGEVSLPKALAQVENKPTRSAPPAEPARALPAAELPKTARQAEAEQAAEDAHGNFDPLAELEVAQKQIEQMTAELRVAEADDLKAEALKWRRIAEQAQRRQGELMQTVADREKELQRQARTIARVCKACGESDPSKVAAAVEAIFRKAVPV